MVTIENATRTVDPQVFRDAMGTVAAAVSIVATTEDATPHATTVSAFMSLSLEPPMVVVSLDNKSTLLSIVERTREVSVNVLESHQAEAASIFASKREDRFAGVDWRLRDGLPEIIGNAAWLSCAVTAFVPGGDHTLLLCLVRDADITGGDPMVYHRRQFGTHVAV